MRYIYGKDAKEILETVYDFRKERTMEISCKTCIHKKVCDLWRKQECQSAKNFFNDECELYAAESKKGRWIFTRYYVWKCSECGKNPTMGMGYTQRKSELFRYCPCCGSKMEVTE